MKQYQHLITLFENHLKKFNSELDRKHPSELYLPANYILSLGGKRIRPLLTLIACDLFETNASNALDAALAVELFHNFSLIHDDILDNAPIRRNQETVHQKWNTNIAILSGDALMVRAFQMLEKYEGHPYKQLNSILLNTAIEVCEGQQMDMNFESSNQVNTKDYMQMITYKTAVLLGCSLKMGAILSNANEKDQSLIYEFGKQLGIAFQLLDDLLDAFSENSDKFGKQIGGDILANKKTYLLLRAIELSNDSQRAEINKILNLSVSESPAKIGRMLSIYNDLNIKHICQQEANLHTRKAIESLGLIQADGPKRNNLQQFAIDLLNRQI